MEASGVPQDAGHSGPLSRSSCSSSLPPPRPGRPPPPPLLSRPSQLPAPLFPPLPHPISPIILSSSPPRDPTSDPTVAPPSSPFLLSSLDRLLGSVSVWQLRGLSPDTASRFLENQPAGTFLAHTAADRVTMISVRLPDEGGAPAVRGVAVQQHHTFVHLEGSSLLFDDVFKLISFYCTSRDILAMPLKLPLSVAVATREEDLEVLSALGKDFWMSDLNQRPQNPDRTDQPNAYLYVNPVPVEGPSSERKSSVSKPESFLSEAVTPSLQNGEMSKKSTPQVKVPKRPPPRPPILTSGLLSSPLSPPATSSGTPESDRKEEERVVSEKEGRKSTSPPPPRPTAPQLPQGATPPAPQLPQGAAPPVPQLPQGAAPPVPQLPQGAAFPVPQLPQGAPFPVPQLPQGAPPVPQLPQGAAPPAPLQCTSGCQLSAKEDGQNLVKNTEGEKRKEKWGSRAGLLGEEAEQEEAVKRKAPEEQELKLLKEDMLKTNSSSCLAIKKPSRPVPPPRTKPTFANSAGSSNKAAGGPTDQRAGMKAPPPSPPQRPDVSLYSPQGGAALAADLDSCSTSSTEEEGEVNQEQDANPRAPADRSCTKAAVRRTPTIMLDRARLRLSTVLTGLIHHDGRLTKRIIELARDPVSYFGNLVKDHRAFTLETMSKHTTSTELLQEIRQMMTQLKSYLLQSTELQALLEPQHQYTQDKLETLVEAALCKSVLKPLKEPIYRSLERLHAESRRQMEQNQAMVLASTTTALGICTSVPEAAAMERISLKLRKLHQEYSPQRKIQLLLKACRLIYHSMSVSCPGRAHGADDFLPVMMYVLARSNMAALQLDVEYMMELMDPALTQGEGSYYLTTTYGALEHIKTFDQQRSATRQLSREVQDSIHRWERRRTLNQERSGHDSVRDFLTVFCPEIGVNPKTLGVLPTTSIQELTEQCAARFEQAGFTLSVFVDGVLQPVAPTDRALSVKNRCQPGAYCFLYHLPDQPSTLQVRPDRPEPPQVRSCPSAPPPPPPGEDLQIVSPGKPEEEEALIDL
ncbi:ras and Rab interactor 3 isoform X2 [Gambusia affinis]|nr:ras and Rab interactor 3 isoform X2 [Gambusia affinis]XP_043998038.1 ras and Rab interactor 3 isoform X2 [Gambusia affinis]